MDWVCLLGDVRCQDGRNFCGIEIWKGYLFIYAVGNVIGLFEKKTKKLGDIVNGLNSLLGRTDTTPIGGRTS